MRTPKSIAALLLVMLPLIFGFHYHKYYTSVTQVEYVPKKKSIQIISRVFIDDLESVLKERYNENIILGSKEEHPKTDFYINKYITDKLNISINNQNEELVFIGKKYDTDIVKCYLEIENITNIKSFKISNSILFDVFEDQQNTIKTNINSKQKSFTLTKKNKIAFLEF